MSAKVSSTVRQEVPEGAQPDDLPEPRGLQGVARRPMPIARPTRSIRVALSRQFSGLGKSVLAGIEASGLFDPIAQDATEYMRRRGLDKAATGQGGRPLDPANARRITRLFSRPPFELIAQFLQTELDKWQVDAQVALEPEYAGAYTAAGRAAQRKLTVRANFNLRNPGILRQLGERVNFLTGGVSQDTFDRIRTVIAREFYFEGQGPPAVAKALRSEFSWLSKTRSELIARTETLAVTSEAQHSVFTASGVEFKRWLTTLDGRERETHFEAHGQLVRIDEAFEVGGVRLMYPGDSFGEGPNLIKEIANCRCDHIPVVMAGQQFDQSTVWDGGLAPDEFAAQRAA